MAPLSVSTPAGVPQWAKAVMKVSTTSGPVVTARAWLAMAGSGVVVDDVEDFHLGVIGQAPVGDVGLPAVRLGCSASKRFHDERGRFCGWPTTKPRRDRIRQIVDTAGTLATARSRARCSAMVAAPAS